MIRKCIDTPIGPLTLTVEGGYLTGLGFGRLPAGLRKARESADAGRTFGEPRSRDLAVLEEAVRQLESYFQGQLTAFSIPVAPCGAPFHLKVWEELKKIPYGETRTYQEIGEAIGSPRAARAVGNACAANPVAIVVPCHRVLAKNGLGGFGGGLPVKKWLLQHEGMKLPLVLT